MRSYINNSLLIFALVLAMPGLSAEQELLDRSDDRYEIDRNVLIRTRDGASLSAMVVKPSKLESSLPAILQFTIYVRDDGRDLEELKRVADRGFVGVIAYTRGKRFSPEEIFPYEYDSADAYDVIDWISKQDWCNGSVGMYGGSYNGFTQWAATKRLHPALKTIVPYVASRPGMGLPMENNIFVNPNYEWSLYVGTSKYLDNSVGDDRQRFRKMQNEWWETGAAYASLDQIDGEPNRLFQRWIGHPSFDEYWQNMAPYGNEFEQIDIPILSIDGYYNDSQNSGLYYLREHYKYRPDAEHYLIIGPYSHFGAQREGQAVINGYEVDPNALINTPDITFQWFDYIFKKGSKPQILKDRINYQVMGADEWRSAPSIEAMSNKILEFYLSQEKSGAFYSLDSKKPNEQKFLYQEVDFTDRKTSNNDYYPDPIIRREIDATSGYVFISEPLRHPLIVNGSFDGTIVMSINKRDVDIGITLYELTPAGDYFHLSYFVGRASYAKDITTRNLLTPGEITIIPFSNTHLVSKQLSTGSRLVVAINVNKNPFSQLNYGTGRDVSKESIADANEPLQIRWSNESLVRIPVLSDK